MGRAQDESGRFHAFVTTLSGGAITLSSLDARADGDYGAALGINSAGDVTGYYTTAGEHMSARNRVFVYRDFGVTDVGTFGGEDGVAVAVNDAAAWPGFSALSRTPTMPSTALSCLLGASSCRSARSAGS